MDGKLKDVNIHWKDGAAVCVVLASKGYPEKVESGKRITFSPLAENTICFHAGTKMNNGEIVTSGGRVLGVTAWADNLESAIHKVYSNVSKITFDGMQYRKDIAYRALEGTK